MNVPSAKHVPTLFLKAVIIAIAILVIVGCAFLFPHLWKITDAEWPMSAFLLYAGLIGIYLTLIPFLFALSQAFTLLHFIDKNNAFSEASITALRNIKFAAVVMSLLYMIALPLPYVFAELDDAPGVVLIATAFACAPLVVATFAAVLQKLVRSAVDMKTEHDLTV